jgi:hypothetical protein
VSQLLSLLAQLDSFCGQLAAAIHGAEPRLYALLTLAAVVGFFAFRPEDRDEI